MCMVQEERSPALRRWAPMSGHVLGNRSLADIDAKLEEFSINARSAPERVSETHLSDQPTNFGGYLWPAESSARLPPPERAKASSVPAGKGFRLDHRKCFRISGAKR